MRTSRENNGVLILRLTTLKLAGTVILVVAIGGVIATALAPASAERIWLSICPLISTAIGAMLVGRVHR